jgi:hypothetical protein
MILCIPGMLAKLRPILEITHSVYFSPWWFYCMSISLLNASKRGREQEQVMSSRTLKLTKPTGIQIQQILVDYRGIKSRKHTGNMHASIEILLAPAYLLIVFARNLKASTYRIYVPHACAPKTFPSPVVQLNLSWHILDVAVTLIWNGAPERGATRARKHLLKRAATLATLCILLSDARQGRGTLNTL